MAIYEAFQGGRVEYAKHITHAVLKTMPKAPAETLESFLRRQDASDLADLLIELATEHKAVEARLARMQMAGRPDKLAAVFKRTLAAWRRSTRFHDYRESREFGRSLQAYVKAYGHAARYLARLSDIAKSGVDRMPLQSHVGFEAEIRAKHARKAAFWAHVNGKRAEG